MKNIILSLCTFFSFLCLSAEKGNLFTLIGQVDGKVSGKVYLRYSNHNKNVTDSAELKNGKFIFKGLLIEPTLALLADDRKRINDIYENSFSDFYIEPSQMTIYLVNNNFHQAVLKGCHTDETYKIFKKNIKPTLDRISDLQKIIKFDSAKASLLSDSLVVAYEKIKGNLLRFIKKYPNSHASIKAVQIFSNFNDISTDSSLAVLNLLTYQAKHYYLAQTLYKAFRAKVTSSRSHLPDDFIRSDVNGRLIKLSSFKGKVVLLDFWASWCEPCRKLTPQIKKLYEKYRLDDLIVVAISCDSKFDDWQNAIKHDRIESFWNILSFTDTDMKFLKTNDVRQASWEGELRKHFNVMPIPVEILLDKNGLVIDRYGGDEKLSFEMLQEKLAELFDKY